MKAPRTPVGQIIRSEGQPFRIVGIGASAGGLEALEQFFTHVPSDSGMAFVIVQHLDPTRHSSMPEILSRLTKMTVHTATDAMKIEPNSVYLIPPDKNMGIQDDALYLHEVGQPRGLRLPVDFFLRSLAKEKGPDAICIILSGTGTDGTLGLRAVKAEAGTVFVQDPKTARYDGMPRSAIDTGLADFVLPPEKIPEKLVDFVRHYVANGTKISAVTEEIQEPTQQIFAILRSRTGHDFSRYKQSTIQRRLQRRMSVHSLHEVSEYARLLRDSEAEVKALLKDVLISVTSFFRDPEAFDVLKGKLCELVKGADQGSDLRVWVAGCATGEEAYSIAIIIAECMDEMEKHLPLQMYATDIDADALSAARAGVYPDNIAADITPERLKRVFVKENKHYRVKKEMREVVVFAPQDFIKDPPFSRMDLICCRNLLIYLESEVQKKILPLLHYALKPGGLLFLGTSEGVGEATDLFSVLDKKWKIYQRREVAVSPERLMFPAAFAPPLREPVTGQAAPLTEARVPELTEKIFLDNYAPTFAVVDEKYRLVYVRGRTGKYLEIASGQPSLSILEMAREGLRTDLASVLYRATSEKKTVVHEGVRVKYNGGLQTINLTVAPLAEHGIPSGMLMVVFQEVGTATTEAIAKPARGRRRTAKLEEELRLTRENLQSTIEELEATNEELKSANEELQSINEELQSTNEELDTSREELQSVNEEMMTVNAELSAKAEMLTKANDDLKNYLNRTDIAIIFLDKELKIRSFTPATADVFNIREVDIGRPLEEITSRLAYEKVVDDAREMLRTLGPKEIEVQRKDGHWYNMRILPYLTVENALGGLVMSFLDIDKQKQAAAGLRRLASVVEDSNDAIITHDIYGKILTWNRGAQQMYGYSEAEALKMSIYQLVPEAELAQSRSFLDDMRGKEVAALEVKRKAKDGRILDVLLTTTRLVDDHGRMVGIAATERDITERKQAQQKLAEFEKLAYLGKLAGTIAHEIRNPLAVIDTSALYLEKTLKDADGKTQVHLERMRSAVGRAATIIDKLLEHARMKEPVMAEIDLLAFIRSLTEGVPRTIEVALDIPENGLVVNGDVEQLRIAFGNIIKNAGEAMGGKGRLAIAVHRVPHEVELSISDTGPGIPAENIDRLFQPLFTTKPGGVGFGLAITKAIIERHNGSITAKSDSGKGATFIIRLPLTEKTQEKTR
ncbi:MAG: PAS domain S-box protein [Chloroflexi bacterium]|nr:PAS domain S-box protein [Chloroflexota bacterium]